MTADPAGRLDEIFRAEYGRVVAGLARRFGDLDIAEDAASEAVAQAAQDWPAGGVPPNPGGWLATTARNKALDRLRRERTRDAKYAELGHRAERDTSDQDPFAMITSPEAVPDDRLRLIFTCCHPALAEPVRVALTLRMLGGLTVAEIADAFLVAEPTMAQRITRAKSKIKAAKIPYQLPEADELPERLGGVLAVLYLIFNEGYLARETADRVDLADEAIRLSRIVCALVPESTEAAGLLALMLLSHSRRAARFSDSELIPLADQDRTRWDRDLRG